MVKFYLVLYRTKWFPNKNEKGCIWDESLRRLDTWWHRYSGK